MKLSLTLTVLLLFFVTAALNTVLAGSYMIVDSETATNPARITAPIDFPREDYRITVTYTAYLNREADATIGEADFVPICSRYGNGRKAYYSGGFQKQSASGALYDYANGVQYYKRIFKFNCKIYKKSAMWNKIHTVISEHYSQLAAEADVRYTKERRWYRRIGYFLRRLGFERKAKQQRALANRYL